MSQTLYLNNSGSRWVVSPREKVLVFHGAERYCKLRTIEFYEQFGNFVVACFRYQGKLIKRFLDEADGKRVVFVDHTEKMKLTNWPSSDAYTTICPRCGMSMLHSEAGDHFCNDSKQ